MISFSLWVFLLCPHILPLLPNALSNVTVHSSGSSEFPSIAQSKWCIRIVFLCKTFHNISVCLCTVSICLFTHTFHVYIFPCLIRMKITTFTSFHSQEEIQLSIILTSPNLDCSSFWSCCVNSSSLQQPDGDQRWSSFCISLEWLYFT